MDTRVACRCSSGSWLQGTRVPAAALVPAAAALALLCRLTAHSTARSRAAALAGRGMAALGARQLPADGRCLCGGRGATLGSRAANLSISSLPGRFVAVGGAAEVHAPRCETGTPRRAGPGLASWWNYRPLALHCICDGRARSQLRAGGGTAARSRRHGGRRRPHVACHTCLQALVEGCCRSAAYTAVERIRFRQLSARSFG